MSQYRVIKTRLHWQSFVARRRLVNAERLDLQRSYWGRNAVFTFLVQKRRSTTGPKVTARGSTILTTV